MPEWNKKRRVMRRYDQSTRVYDAQYSEEQEEKIKTIMNNLTVDKGSIILDGGCGTGVLFRHVAEKAEFIVGTDISKGVLKEARKKAEHYKNVALVLADTDNMPFHDRAFDVVFAVTLLQNTPNPRETLNEIKRVGKADATIVVTGLRKSFTKEEFSKMLRQVNLKVTIMKLDEQMREYIAVCARMRR